MNYLNARYYEGSRGQFISQDPVFWEIGLTEDGNRVLLDPQLQNSYSYSRNNPIIKSDPSGRIIDTIADIGFIAYDLYDLTRAYLKGESVKEQLVYLSLDVGGAAVPFVTGVGMVARTAKAAKVAGEGTKMVREAEKANDVVKASNAIIDLAEHERQVSQYGVAQVKYLENGKIRYYGDITKASKEGEMAGMRKVREWNPANGVKRTWFETLDNNNIVRQIRVGENPKIHYVFDQLGNFVRKW